MSHCKLLVYCRTCRESGIFRFLMWCSFSFCFSWYCTLQSGYIPTENLVRQWSTRQHSHRNNLQQATGNTCCLENSKRYNVKRSHRTIAISLLTLSLGERRYVLNETILIYFLSLWRGVLCSDLLSHTMNHLVFNASQQIAKIYWGATKC